MNKIDQEWQNAWQSAYDKLNVSQKKAVDTIEGPVMTIAGPGTGKTQLLAVRIGKILQETDVRPNNILCLTYTDAGVIAMRRRLASFIGPEAYNVNIHTFHAFCNSIIKENMQYFGDFRELQLISEVEEIEVFRQLIDNFDDNHLLKRLKGNVYFEKRLLKNLFSTMKQEKWTAEDIKIAYENYESTVMNPETSPYIWGRGGKDKAGNTYKKGDFNAEKAKNEMARYAKGVAAACELENYNAIMAKRERFDYQDMILWVIDKLKKYDDLLAKYQENFQYILVDEYQDTNGAQNELLFLLADFWEEPNLFIVGDDDQSIFRFQGANMSSIIDFKKRYDPVEVVLTDNYRSTQKILNSAKKLIEYNDERLVNKYPHLVKELLEKRIDAPSNAVEPEIIEYHNVAQEETGIIRKINKLHEDGVPYRNMAVIYTKHKVVENLIRYFSQKKIPVNVKKRVNVLLENEVIRLTNILTYLDYEYSKPHSAEDLLFEILHYDFFSLSAKDIAAIAILCRKKSDENGNKDGYLKWREVISNKDKLADAGVADIERVIRLSELIEQWLADIANVTIQTLIEKILTDGNILHSILYSADKSWRLQLINTFFDFVKNEAAKVKTLTLKQVVELVDLMRENSIELPVYRIISNENGINFMTAHGAKGLEFEHVFMMRSNKNMWEDKTGGNDKYLLPPTLTSSTEGGEIEDDRRLFYVAMTRAKDYLYISYPASDDNEKLLEATRFIDEIKSPGIDITKPDIPEEDIIVYKAELMRYQIGELKLIDGDLVNKILENFKISATSLNKYLKCRLTFYFETILRVPMGRSATMGFGNAIHYSLEHYFRDIENSNPRSIAGLSKLLEYFSKGIEIYKSHYTPQEFENYSKHGINLLTDYYQEYHKEWLVPKKYEIEYNIPSTEYKGVPISGKLDRINIYDDHLSVTDYKTGQYDSKKLKISTGEENDLGGDYWRQIIFYRLLLDGHKRHHLVMKKGSMDFVEKYKVDNKYKKKDFTIETVEMDIVGNQLVSAFSDIKNHKFTPGCGEAECKWCNFVTRNMPVVLSEVSEDNEEENYIIE